MAKGFREHFENLDHERKVLRVKREVDPAYELPAVAKALHRRFGSAILFENVKGCSMPLVTYIYPDRTAAAQALGMEAGTIAQEWAARESHRIPPKRVETGPVKEVVLSDPVDIRTLPIITHSEGDAGPYITGGVVIARHPVHRALNASFNRLQLVDRDKLRVRMMPPQHLGRYHQEAENLSRPLEAAIVIGAPPAVMFSAASKIPYERDELEFAGALAGEPLEVTPCSTIDVDVPARAEIVIEGEVLPNVREEEGPFGEFTDGYVPVMKNHVFRIKAISRRKDPLYHNIYAGGLEDLMLLGIPIEAEVYKHVVKYAPEITGVSTTSFVFNCVIGIKKRDEEQPKNVILSALASYSWIKMCVVVDEDVDIYDSSDVLWAIQTRCRPDRDILIVPGVSSYTREDVRQIHIGKFGIDATMPLNMRSVLRRRVIPGENMICLEDYLDK
jgi:2,5-furandicarboxylate decarboxylase 1